MMRSLFSGLSGLKGHQSRMDVVGNNISNVNTTGFKSSRVTFADMLSQNLKGASSGRGNVGGTNPKQIGLGTNVASTDLIFKDGSILTTGKNTDLALSGDGMFVVQKNGHTYYTRDGAFEFDAAGNYVLPGSGHFVQGCQAVNGVIDTTGAVGNIQIAKGQVMEAQPTTKVDFLYNLDASTPMVKELTGGRLYETVTKVPKTETQWEEVPGVGILPERESRYNLNVKIGDDDYILHNVMNNDIDLSKNCTVQSINRTITDDLDTTGTLTLVDENGNTSHIVIIAKNSNINIKAGDIFNADTSYLRLQSTVNKKSPLEFSVNGVNYKAVGMDHSVEIPGEGWYVTAVDDRSNPTRMTIVQYQNGQPDGCSVVITLDDKIDSSKLPAVGGKLEFKGNAITATHLKPVTVTTWEDVVTVTDGTYKYYNSKPIETTVDIYDSLGNLHKVPVYFVREGEQDGEGVKSVNKWLVSLEKNAAVQKGDITTYEFLDADGNKITATMPTAEIQFDSSGNLVTSTESGETPDISGLITLNYTSGATGTDGVTPAEPTVQNVIVDFADLTQFASNTTVSSESDGNVAGTLKEIQIDNSGMMTGIYTNDEHRPEGQVAIAHFTNFTGLTKTGTSLFQESENSGVAVLDAAENMGVTVTPGALEMSNVDIAAEFADMIVTQRGFQSNSKIIMVGDEMIETAVNMKR
ncbi:MAG: flagellar hook-basal body complex protein [Selenomonadaceae bacterium]|nr:flagellar hook-basal body complex protein [Selenomonadaceae bacterium]MBP3723875.1 flagellar hook-basal body complex protein [Selenomonadaceae bacterium]